MSSKSAGKILPLPRGEYDPTATYDFLDVVSLENRLWVAIEAGISGVAPEAGSNVWKLLIDGTIAEANCTDILNDMSARSEAIMEAIIARSDETFSAMEAFQEKLTETVLYVNPETGNIEYTSPNYKFNINEQTGNLEWEVV